MTKPRAPRTTNAAIALLERFAVVTTEIDTIEADRAAALAAINAPADMLVAPLVEERDALLAVIEPWWQANSAELTKGERKSIELGGCMIGSRAGRAKVTFEGGDAKGVEALQEHRWGKAFLTFTTSLDKRGIMAGLRGPKAESLKVLGFSAPAAETFFLERVQLPTVGR